MLSFIYNPIAGGKHGKKMDKTVSVLKAEMDKRDIAYTFYPTMKKGDATLITEKLIKEGATDLVAIGGDGTLHEIINGFSDFDKVALGIIPCGTGNDFVSALKIPSDPVKALNLITDGTPKYTDFMQMPTVRGLNIIGMGIDVEVLKRYQASKRKTQFTYTKSLIKTLMKFDYTEFDAELNGKKEHYRSFIACVANGFRYGGGIPICPVADATDNVLDFVAIKSIKKLKMISAFLKLKKGKILTLKESVHDTMQEIKIYPTGDYTVNVDGELYDNIPFEIKIVSNTLRIYRD